LGVNDLLIIVSYPEIMDGASSSSIVRCLADWLGCRKYSIIEAMPEKQNLKSFVKEVIITLALAAVIFLGARATIQTYEVFQSSMLPNFHPGERVVVNKAVYWFGGPQRGDVVILKAANGADENWIKRIIGLPGDTVEIVSGATYINGVKLDEPYVRNRFTYSFAKITVPEGKYFFLGDNREVSNDSSRGWLMERQALIGKAWLISWPPSEWGTVPKYDLGKQLAAPVTATAAFVLTE
jgi:signal peptidase I